MTHHGTFRFFLAVHALLFVATFPGSGSRGDWPAPYFFDDFEDGSATDGAPVNWVPEVPPFDGGMRQVIDGDFVMTPGTTPITSSLGTFYENDSIPVAVTPTDISIRILIRDMSPGWYWIGAWARYHDNIGMSVGIWSDGRIYQARTMNTELVSPQVAETGIDITTTDVHLQYDVFGSRMSLTVWPDGSSKPSVPQLSTSVPVNYREPGTIGLIYTSFEGPAPIPASIEYFAALPTPYATLVRGDFDDSLTVDASDIDALKPGSSDLKYDVNLDGTVDAADRTFWVEDVRHTWFGDADLDGQFNSADFVHVFQAGKYETDQAAGWAEGDWNGDGLFESADFITAFVDGGYEQGERPAAMVVPEPAGLLLLTVAALGALIRRRR